MSEVSDPPAVELRNVTKSFGSLRVLDNVSLSVPTGRAFCILGRSGTGKSVTLKSIIGLIQPDSGQVLVQGEDIVPMSNRERVRVRMQIGFLFQYAALFDSISVGENVAFPLRRHTQLPDAEIRARSTDLLAQVGLEREYDKMPEGRDPDGVSTGVKFPVYSYDASQPDQGSLTVLIPHDQLGNHRIVIHADFVTLQHPRVHPDMPVFFGSLQVGQGSGGGQKIVIRIFRVYSRLESMTVDFQIFLKQWQGFTRRNP